MIIDDMYANRDIRIYKDFSPTIRSERSGLKVVINIPCSTKKTKNGSFCSVKDMSIKDVGKPFANAVTATYFNHADSTDNSNLVIVKEIYERDNQTI